MNFYNKKFKRIMSAVIITVIVAMLATSVLPYMI